MISERSCWTRAAVDRKIVPVSLKSGRMHKYIAGLMDMKRLTFTKSSETAQEVFHVIDELFINVHIKIKVGLGKFVEVVPLGGIVRVKFVPIDDVGFC